MNEVFFKEFKIWKQLRSPSIIQLLGYSKVESGGGGGGGSGGGGSGGGGGGSGGGVGGSLAMVMPFCETDLENLLQQDIKPPLLLRLAIAKQMCAGMAYAPPPPFSPPCTPHTHPAHPFSFKCS